MKRRFKTEDFRDLVGELSVAFCPAAERRWGAASRLYDAKRKAYEDGSKWNMKRLYASMDASDEMKKSFYWCAFLVIRHLLKEAGYKRTKSGYKKGGQP